MTCWPRPTPSFGEALGPEGRTIPSGFKGFVAGIGIRFWEKSPSTSNRFPPPPRFAEGKPGGFGKQLPADAYGTI